MKADQERVKALLQDTIVLLCRSGLSFDTELKIEGVVGITVNRSDVFIVHINETMTGNIDNEDLKFSVFPGSSNNIYRPYETSDAASDADINIQEESLFNCNDTSALECNELQGGVSINNEPNTMDCGTAASRELLQEQLLAAIKHENEKNICSSSNDLNNSLRKHSFPLQSVRTGARRGRKRGVKQYRKPRRHSYPINRWDRKVFESNVQQQRQDFGDISARQSGVWSEAEVTATESHPLDPEVMTNGCAETNHLNGNGQPDISLTSPLEKLSESFQNAADMFGQPSTSDSAHQVSPVFGQNSGGGTDKALSPLSLHADMMMAGLAAAGGRGFMCEFDGCGLSFAHSYTLYRHQRLKHGRRLGNTEQQLFHCPHESCGRVFCREGTLYNHIRDVHRVP